MVTGPKARARADTLYEMPLRAPNTVASGAAMFSASMFSLADEESIRNQF